MSIKSCPYCGGKHLETNAAEERIEELEKALKQISMSTRRMEDGSFGPTADAKTAYAALMKRKKP